jgi:PAS domain S-box-containing protein
MRSEGIDVDSSIGSGALKVITKRDSYLKDGYFDPDSMIKFLKEAIDSSKKAGFAALRVTGEMTWALGSDPGDERLIEYEAKLNYFIPKNDVLAICQYNRSRFPPEIIIDVIHTHPLVISGSIVCENFYFVPPDEFLGPKNTHIALEVERLLKNIQDYERAEKKLREGSLYTRSLIEASLDPLVTISLDGKITDVNIATELVTGVSREDLIGEDFSDYFTTPEKARKGYQEVFEKGFVRDYPLAIRHISGNITEVLYNATVYKNESGEVQGVFAAARDITQRKRAEEQLRIASLYARNLIETSLDPLVTISPQGKIMDVNNATELVTGIPREELIGSDFSNYFTEPEEARKGYHEVFEKGFVRDYPLAIRHISGRITDVLYNASVYRDPSGNIAGVFAAARDITERKKAQEAHSMLASIVEFSEDGIIGKTMDGNIVSWNPGAEKLYGFSENEVIGKPISILIPSGHFDEMPVILERIKWGETIEHFEAVRIRKDGKRIDVSLTISPIKDAQGRIIGASTIARDITEHKKIEKQLQDASLYVRNLIEASLEVRSQT